MVLSQCEGWSSSLEGPSLALSFWICCSLIHANLFILCAALSSLPSFSPDWQEKCEFMVTVWRLPGSDLPLLWTILRTIWTSLSPAGELTICTWPSRQTHFIFHIKLLHYYFIFTFHDFLSAPVKPSLRTDSKKRGKEHQKCLRIKKAENSN